jgi:hypothetical protein
MRQKPWRSSLFACSTSHTPGTMHQRCTGIHAHMSTTCCLLHRCCSAGPSLHHTHTTRHQHTSPSIAEQQQQQQRGGIRAAVRRDTWWTLLSWRMPASYPSTGHTAAKQASACRTLCMARCSWAQPPGCCAIACQVRAARCCAASQPQVYLACVCITAQSVDVWRLAPGYSNRPFAAVRCRKQLQLPQDQQSTSRSLSPASIGPAVHHEIKL